jgi:hypothetical protein
VPPSLKIKTTQTNLKAAPSLKIKTKQKTPSSIKIKTTKTNLKAPPFFKLKTSNLKLNPEETVWQISLSS